MVMRRLVATDVLPLPPYAPMVKQPPPQPLPKALQAQKRLAIEYPEEGTPKAKAKTNPVVLQTSASTPSKAAAEALAAQTHKQQHYPKLNSDHLRNHTYFHHLKQQQQKQ